MFRVGKETGRLGTAIRGGGKRLAVALLAGSLLVAGLGTTGTAAVSPDADPAVIRDWNATAVATIVVDAGKANAEAFLWLGYVAAPVYNAVVGMRGRVPGVAVDALIIKKRWPSGETSYVRPSNWAK